MFLQGTFDMRDLLVGEIEHVRLVHAAQVHIVDLLACEHRNLLIQVRRDLIGERGEANHGRVTSCRVRADSYTPSTISTGRRPASPPTSGDRSSRMAATISAICATWLAMPIAVGSCAALDAVGSLGGSAWPIAASARSAALMP